jgi:dTDP-4-amino-4,6-dideoxygalactose transaminase
MTWRIPLFDTAFDEDDLAAVQRPLEAGWLTMGEEAAGLEDTLSRRIGVEHCLATTNGTAALHLACAALGLGPEDEVLCPTLTFVASANAICYTGARPVFCESYGEHDLGMDPEDARARITDCTRAMMVVHYAGYPCNMPALMEIARESRLAVIEDCAHAVFSRADGTTCGAFGDVGCYSFFSNKNITCGEGGAVVTHRPDVAERLRLLRSHGMTSLTLDRHRGHAFTYDVVARGYNYRLDEIRAALLRAQLMRLDCLLERRREVVARYQQALDGSPITLPFAERIASADWPTTAVHILPVLLPEGTDRIAVMKRMKEAGIQTSIHYRPVHRFQAYTQRELSLPLTESLAERELTLPLFPEMDPAMVDAVVDNLLSCFCR